MLPRDQHVSFRQSIEAFSGTNLIVKYLHVFNYNLAQAGPRDSLQYRDCVMDALYPLKRCLVGQKNTGLTRVKDWGLGINWHLPSSYDLRWILYFFVWGGLFSSRLIGWIVFPEIREFRWQRILLPEDESQYNQLHNFKTYSLFLLAAPKFSLQRSCRQWFDINPVTIPGF